MNTPMENLILDLIALEQNNDFEARHGFDRNASQALRMAIILAERRLQEEADCIAEAYNSAGGAALGSQYFINLYRSGEDSAKSYANFDYRTLLKNR